MVIRYFFKDECAARRAVNDSRNLGYWACLFKTGVPAPAVIGVECSELALGLIESRYRDFIL